MIFEKDKNLCVKQEIYVQSMETNEVLEGRAQQAPY